MNMPINKSKSFYTPYEPFKVDTPQYNFGSMTNYVDSVPVLGDFPTADPNSTWSAFFNRAVDAGSDYFTNTPVIPKFNPLTGKTSGSILGDFGSLANFGLQGTNVYGQFQGLKEARKNRELMADQMNKQNNLARAQIGYGLETAAAKRQAQAGVSSEETRQKVRNDPNTYALMAKYGLN